MRSIRSRVEFDAGEDIITLGTTSSWNGRYKRGIIFAHGSGGTAWQTLTDAAHRYSIYELAQFGMVQTADWAFQSWGNMAAVNSIDAGVQRLRSFGVTGPVALVGISMGGANILNYARRHPENVACVAGVLALTDVGKVYDDNPGQVQTEIDAAYSGFDALDRAEHSPLYFAHELDMPIKLWTAPDDTVVVPSQHSDFVSARPETEQEILPAGGGHSAYNVYVAADSVANWVRNNS